MIVVVLFTVVAAALAVTGCVCERMGFANGIHYERMRVMASMLPGPERPKVVPVSPRRPAPYDWAREPDITELEEILGVVSWSPTSVERQGRNLRLVTS